MKLSSNKFSAWLTDEINKLEKKKDIHAERDQDQYYAGYKAALQMVQHKTELMED